MGSTLFEKVWDPHVVLEEPGEPALLYVDLHLVHEVTSARRSRAPPRRAHVPADRCDRRDDGPQRPDAARADHRSDGEGAARRAAGELRGVRRPPLRDGLGTRGIVHVIGPSWA